MLAAKKGHIVNISSDAARQLFGALTVYNAAKAFVQVFSKGLRAECVGTGLRVTDVQPGDTATGLIMRNDDPEAAEKMGVNSDHRGDRRGGGGRTVLFGSEGRGGCRPVRCDRAGARGDSRSSHRTERPDVRGSNVDECVGRISLLKGVRVILRYGSGCIVLL